MRPVDLWIAIVWLAHFSQSTRENGAPGVNWPGASRPALRVEGSKLEFHAYVSSDLYRVPHKQVRPIAPLLHCVDSRRGEFLRTRNQP
jgi:hypothetical protein